MPREIIDLSDRIFGKLVVVDREMDPQKKIQTATTWYCICECGNFKHATSTQLRTGRVTSCGCNLEEGKKKRLIDITGQKFGKLTALYRVENQGSKSAWMCKCDCGKYREAKTGLLRAGRVKSCGLCDPNRKGRKPQFVYDSI